jgi:hypothetical protein
MRLVVLRFYPRRLGRFDSDAHDLSCPWQAERSSRLGSVIFDLVGLSYYVNADPERSRKMDSESGIFGLVVPS